MAKPIEQDLADYLLSLAPGPWMPKYIQDCLAMWSKEFGERVTLKVEAILLKEGKR